jgi:hypothetical protein
MDGLSPLAWVAIAVIVVVASVVNLWMVSLLRNKDLRDQKFSTRLPARGLSAESMQKLVRLLRNPFVEQQDQLNQLSKLVENLKDQEKDPPMPK